MLTPFWVALQFLTRLPVRLPRVDARDFRRAPLWFPLVGAVMGALLWLAWLGLESALPPTAARTVVLVLGVALTGALHLDGLSDATDGLFAGDDRESALRIMRDPHAGVMGTTSVLSVLLLKGSALWSLPADRVGASLLLACVVGRSLMLAGLMLRPAREEGLGHACAQPRTVGRAVVCLLTGVGVPTACLGLGALAPVGLAALAAGSLLAVASRMLGGVTGDVCGGSGELGETGFLIGTAGLFAAGAKTAVGSIA